jgi:hypothetical protein
MGRGVARQFAGVSREGRRSTGMTGYKGVKVFSATKAKEREDLGEQITAWIRDNPGNIIKDTVVSQSSDNEFHCLSIVIFYDY